MIHKQSPFLTVYVNPPALAAGVVMLASASELLRAEISVFNESTLQFRLDVISTALFLLLISRMLDTAKNTASVKAAHRRVIHFHEMLFFSVLSSLIASTSR